jgi:hypothetical protein
MNVRVIKVSPSLSGTMRERSENSTTIGMTITQFVSENMLLVFVVLIFVEAVLLGGSVYLAKSLYS